MLITQAQVHFSSEHVLETSERDVTAVIENNRLISDPDDPAASTDTRPNRSEPDTAYVNHIDLEQFRVSATHDLLTDEATPQILDYRLMLLKALVEQMTGKTIDTAEIDRSAPEAATAAPTTTESDTDAPASERTVVNLTLDKEYEYSNTTIQALINTADGEQIDVNLQVTMSRRYEETALQVLRQRGELTDPLVISFNGDSVRLSPNLTKFDLDSDGRAEQIARFASNSAYIALDKNGDGLINNGSELFGPETGQGFAELAAYDEDNNGFIDSNDSVYSQLLAFRPGEQDSMALKDLNVGAIYLQAADSPFRLTDQYNQTLGQVRATGFYLNTDGTAGAVQQIDLMT